MTKPVLYSSVYSTYGRTVQLVLEEKGVDYDTVEIDIFHDGGKAPEHLARHPYGKVPTIEHNGLKAYETLAINRYIEEALDGPSLEPDNLHDRIRMTQVISVINSYAFSPMIGKIVIQRLAMPLLGNSCDDAAVEAAVPDAKKALAAIESIMGGDPYLAGNTLSYADLLFIPIYHDMSQTPEGKEMFDASPAIKRWWQNVRGRPSVEKIVTNPS